VSDRVFLDANILVSAAWRSDSGLVTLWALTDIELLTSAYAILEADRNLATPEQRTRLYHLIQRVEIVDEPKSRTLPTINNDRFAVASPC
jgi:predicted nucleic acid-binding protein